MLSSNLVVWLEVKKSKKFINKVPIFIFFIFCCVPKLIYVILQLTNIKVGEKYDRPKVTRKAHKSAIP